MLQHGENIMITGDLGFMAFETLQEKLGNRFINAGVAEQNMISVAAGLAHEHFLPWVYSIAPFAVFRPYEQIRNDVCMHRLPVRIVGNGGGYGYGIMGATHHALEDIAVMRTLPNMHVFVPATSADIDTVIQQISEIDGPVYLRLNTPAAFPKNAQPFGPWRHVQKGEKGVIIGTGPVLGNIFSLQDKELPGFFDIWAAGVLPLHPMPESLVESILRTGKVVVIEEHSAECGLNESVARHLVKLNRKIEFKSISASGYPSGRYGSQKWHQSESGLCGTGLQNNLRSIL